MFKYLAKGDGGAPLLLLLLLRLLRLHLEPTVHSLRFKGVRLKTFSSITDLLAFTIILVHMKRFTADKKPSRLCQAARAYTARVGWKLQTVRWNR